MIAKRIQRKDYVADLQVHRPEHRLAAPILSPPGYGVAYARPAGAFPTLCGGGAQVTERHSVAALYERALSSGRAGGAVAAGDGRHPHATRGHRARHESLVHLRHGLVGRAAARAGAPGVAGPGETSGARPATGGPIQDFQRLGTWARFSPWKAKLAHLLWFRSPSDMMLSSLADFARLGNLMDIPVEQLALGSILAEDGNGRQAARGRIDRTGRRPPDAGTARRGDWHGSTRPPTCSTLRRCDCSSGSGRCTSRRSASSSTRRGSIRRDAWLETHAARGQCARTRTLRLGPGCHGARRHRARRRGARPAAGPGRAHRHQHDGTLHCSVRNSPRPGDPRAALDSSAVIFLRDTTLGAPEPLCPAHHLPAPRALATGLGRSRCGRPGVALVREQRLRGVAFRPAAGGRAGCDPERVCPHATGRAGAKRSDVAIACCHLKRVRELWADVEPAMLPMQGAGRARRKARQVPLVACRALGPVALSVDGIPAPAELLWRKHLALLLYLLRSPRRTRGREHLIGLLWADSEEGEGTPLAQRGPSPPAPRRR